MSPFLRLPVLIQLLILKNVSLLDLFHLSLTSKRAKQVVKSMDLTLEKLTWRLGSDECGIELRNPKKLCIASVPSETINFNGSVLSVAHSESDSYDLLEIRDQLHQNLELMDQLTAHLSDLFTISKYDLVLQDFPSLLNCFVWKYTKQFETVRVTDFSWDPSLSGQEARFLLEEIITDKLVLFSVVDKEFRWDGPLKMRELGVKKGDWLTLEAMLNMDCEKLLFHFTNTITYQYLNAIIKKWLTGGLKNLKEIKVINFNPVHGDSRDTKLDGILEGIETFPWDINNRPGTLGLCDGRDIRRSDGTIATLEYFRDCQALVFHVWDSLSVAQ